MSIVMITGSAGLIGWEATSFFAKYGLDVVGIDNDMRSHFFGAEASTAWNQQRLKSELAQPTVTPTSTSGTRTASSGSFRILAPTSRW
jgi:CDP-paratose 2-epimerase